MTIGSLFSGIGGIEMGLESLGIGPVLWQAENNPQAKAVLRTHWPEVHLFEDVRLIDGTAPRVDIVCGGFPCQDISNAGKRAGIDGARSGLWSEFARVVRELRPSIVFVENVAALAGRGLDRVLRDLAAIGFDAEWEVFRAADVGAPHKRERLFVLAYTVGSKLRIQSKPVTWRGGAAVAGDDGAHVADADSRRRGGVRFAEPSGVAGAQGDVHHGRSGEGAEVDMADAYGAGREGERGIATSGGGRPVSVGPCSDEAAGDVADAAGPRRGHAENQGTNRGDAGPIAEAGRRRTSGIEESKRGGGALGAHRFPPGPDETGRWDGPEPAVRRSVARIPVGMDRGWRTANRHSDRLRLLGNAVVPQQAALAFATLAARAGIDLR